MAMTGLASFDKTIQKTNEWLEELMASYDGLDREKAYLALRATLHTLRDRLPVEDPRSGGGFRHGRLRSGIIPTPESHDTTREAGGRRGGR